MTFPRSRWSLHGRRALITGGTKGIGEAVAAEMLGLGAQVTVVARNGNEVAARVAAWRDAGLPAHGTTADVTSAVGRETALRYALEAMGGLDILVNNVGTNVRKRSLAITPEEYERVFSTNLTSAWEMCRAAHSALSAGGDGRIVNIGSVAGSTAMGSGGPYALTKAAIDHLARYLAVEWAKDGIRVNNVNPWYTRTPLASPVLEKPGFVAAIRARTPLDRIAEPEDISGLVAFLCLPAARHITGQSIAVDGGFLAYGLPYETFDNL
jgi:Tropinone reductase 1